MYNSSMLNRFAAGIDYLAIGHITRDLDPDGGETLGGTAAYAALTAQRLGLRPGILTAFDPEGDLGPLDGIPIAGTASEYSTTFENASTPRGRRQRVTRRAPQIHPYMLPEIWRSAPVVHFGPVLDEIDLSLLRLFPESFIGVTPQGWLRHPAADGAVSQSDWPEAAYVLEMADAAVISEEDVDGDERTIQGLAESAPVLAVTAGPGGCRLFVDGFSTEVRADAAVEVDPTGAGDIFAAAFFTYLFRSQDPLAAARFAVRLGTRSVARSGLAGVPLDAEVFAAAAGLQHAHAPDPHA